MLRLAQLQAGYLGAEAVQDGDGRPLTRCYWDDIDAIAAWRVHAEHLLARESGARASCRSPCRLTVSSRWPMPAEVSA
jgi:heme-degrading monooxygenase HmoA